MSNGYARCASLAYTLCADRSLIPAQAWQQAAAEVFPNSKTSRIKSCPKNAFLGLAAAGYLQGITPFTHHSKNGDYACRAAQILLAQNLDSHLPDPKALWLTVMHDVGQIGKRHNGQMDVALALYHMNVMIKQA